MNMDYRKILPFFLFFFTTLSGAVASTLASGSPGDLSVASHNSVDMLLGSLQSTLQSVKCSWEASSFSAGEQRRSSSKICNLGYFLLFYFRNLGSLLQKYHKIHQSGLELC